MTATTKKLIQFSFNEDGTKLTASTEKQFIVLRTDDFTPLTSSSLFGGIRSINCLHHADLYVLVASGDKPGASPRRAKIWLESQLLQEIALPSTVERTLWNKSHLILLTDRQIFIYELRTLVLRATIDHYPGNICGAMAVGDSNIFCYPCPDVLGQVIVHDCKENRVLHAFAAHRTEISKMVMNSTGTMLCTASKAGTLVRVFQVPSGDLLYTYRISNTSSAISFLQFCVHSPNYLLCGTGKNQWSVCYLGEKTQKSVDDIVNEKVLDFSVEEDDFCRIEVNPQFGVSEGDNDTEVGADTKSMITHQSRPADADQNAGLLSIATAQYLFDFTMKSMQQIRNLSQDYLQPDVSNGGPSTESAAKVSSDAVVGSRKQLRLQNDDIRSADWQCTINIDDQPSVACLVVDDHNEHEGDIGDDISTLAGSVTAGAISTADIDDGWKLKLLVLTNQGVFRKYILNLPGHTRYGVTSTSKAKLTSPALSGSAAESVLQLEDERFVFDMI